VRSCFNVQMVVLLCFMVQMAVMPCFMVQMAVWPCFMVQIAVRPWYHMAKTRKTVLWMVSDGCDVCWVSGGCEAKENCTIAETSFGLVASAIHLRSNISEGL